MHLMRIRPLFVTREVSRMQPVLTVRQLTGLIKDVLEETFTYIYAVGEVSNAKIYPLRTLVFFAQRSRRNFIVRLFQEFQLSN